MSSIFLSDKNKNDILAEKIIDFGFLGVYIVTIIIFMTLCVKTLKIKDNRTYQNCLTFIFLGMTLLCKFTLT